MTDADQTDDLVLFTNTPTQAESPLYIVEQAVGIIGLHMSVVYIFQQEEAIVTLPGKLLKLVDQFTYLCSNISSTESN